MPSAASCVCIRSVKYSCSSSGRGLRQYPADVGGRVLGDARPEAEVRPGPFDGDKLQMRILGDGLERLPERVDHVRGDDVALRVNEAEGGTALLAVERELNGCGLP